jgi:hypothetical protein
MLGVSLGMMVYLGVPVVLLDKFLLLRQKTQKHADAPLLFEQHAANARSS